MTELFLYDTMAREKRRFTPADPSRVTMYVCGPTVYNYAHIGNARPVVAFDVLYRLLRHLYGEDAVVYAANVTDVDDKINAKAAEEGQPIGVISERYFQAYEADMSALGALPPTIRPRATQHIGAIQAIIAQLIRNNAAYAAEGHVLFSVQSFSDYGRLSGRSMDDMIAGARVEVAPYKQHPADFVLWKPSKPGEPVWESPWGPGRPGWHIECSAMIEQALGLPIDIHGGGNDLIFPHHENEIAQSRCAGHAPALANYWLHNGFVNFGSEKMSKSLGNVVLVHELVKLHPGEVLRWALMNAHYRAPVQWSESLVEQARAALDRLYGALRRAADVPAVGAAPSAAFLEALCDDLNTPRAFAELFALARELETGRSAAKGELLASARLIGLLEADPEVWFQGGANADMKAHIDGLIAARDEARRNKDWTTADRIRAELTALGVEVMDGPNGATWRFKDSGGASCMPVAAFRIEHRIGVPAPAHVIWEVMADLERWSEWNPYFTRAEGELKIGTTLAVTEVLPGGETTIIAPVIIDWVPDSQILWRVPERWGLVQRVHYLEIEQLDEGASILSGGEDWYGRLARYVPRSRRHAIRAGITAMNEALRERAIQLWQAQGGAPTSAPT